MRVVVVVVVTVRILAEFSDKCVYRIERERIIETRSCRGVSDRANTIYTRVK